MGKTEWANPAAVMRARINNITVRCLNCAHFFEAKKQAGWWCTQREQDPAHKQNLDVEEHILRICEQFNDQVDQP